jgi:hypothetical protein
MQNNANDEFEKMHGPESIIKKETKCRMLEEVIDEVKSLLKETDDPSI